jgi:hypothetical protein
MKELVDLSGVLFAFGSKAASLRVDGQHERNKERIAADLLNGRGPRAEERWSVSHIEES